MNDAAAPHPCLLASTHTPLVSKLERVLDTPRAAKPAREHVSAPKRPSLFYSARSGGRAGGCWGARLVEARLDLADDIVKRLRAEPVLPQHALGGEHRARVREEEQRRVALRLTAERVGALHHRQLGQQLAYLGHHVQRVEACARDRVIGYTFGMRWGSAGGTS